MFQSLLHSGADDFGSDMVSEVRGICSKVSSIPDSKAISCKREGCGVSYSCPPCGVLAGDLLLQVVFSIYYNVFPARIRFPWYLEVLSASSNSYRNNLSLRDTERDTELRRSSTTYGSSTWHRNLSEQQKHEWSDSCSSPCKKSVQRPSLECSPDSDARRNSLASGLRRTEEFICLDN